MDPKHEPRLCPLSLPHGPPEVEQDRPGPGVLLVHYVKPQEGNGTQPGLRQVPERTPATTLHAAARTHDLARLGHQATQQPSSLPWGVGAQGQWRWGQAARSVWRRGREHRTGISPRAPCPSPAPPFPRALGLGPLAHSPPASALVPGSRKCAEGRGMPVPLPRGRI